MVPVIQDETIDLDKGYYNGIYILPKFCIYYIANRKEDQSYMEADSDA